MQNFSSVNDFLLEYTCSKRLSPKILFMTAILGNDMKASRLVTISQGTARNHFWEAGMLMQSSILDIVK